MWKAVSGELGNLNEKVSNKSVEGAIWFPLLAYSKMWAERDKVKKEQVSEMEPVLDLELLSLSRWQKMLN